VISLASLCSGMCSGVCASTCTATCRNTAAEESDGFSCKSCMFACSGTVRANTSSCYGACTKKCSSDCAGEAIDGKLTVTVSCLECSGSCRTDVSAANNIPSVGRILSPLPEGSFYTNSCGNVCTSGCAGNCTHANTGKSYDCEGACTTVATTDVEKTEYVASTQESLMSTNCETGCTATCGNGCIGSCSIGCQESCKDSCINDAGAYPTGRMTDGTLYSGSITTVLHGSRIAQKNYTNQEVK
jgi:hypothetical protein